MVSKINFRKNVFFCQKSLCEVLTRCHRGNQIKIHNINSNQQFDQYLHTRVTIFLVENKFDSQDAYIGFTVYSYVYIVYFHLIYS